jgi:spore coat polysaccharide biosynthesis protein SpsF
MTVIAVLQARSGSRRLPNKVLRDLVGQPMLARQIERVLRATTLDGLVVATTAHAVDDAVEAVCRALPVRCARGSEDDVLDRVVHAVAADAPNWVVRLTGDCPLQDPSVIDEVVQKALSGDYDYVSNTIHPTFPDGLDVEVVRLAVLIDAHANATLPSEREHVTPYVYKHPERYRIGEVRSPIDRSALRWTVDEPRDFELVEQIYRALYPVNPRFGTSDILDLLGARPELATLNTGISRNEGYARSLQKEQS